jgi:hypothetical protein
MLSTCPQCGNVLADAVSCRICGYNALVAFWLPRIREEMRWSSLHCVEGNSGGRRYWITVTLEKVAVEQLALATGRVMQMAQTLARPGGKQDPASERLTWVVLVEEARGKKRVGMEIYRTAQAALSHYPGLLFVTRWHSFQKQDVPCGLPIPNSVFGDL